MSQARCFLPILAFLVRTIPIVRTRGPPVSLGCALIGTERGTRAGDGTPFEPSDLDETWDETGTVAWASATPAF